MREVGEITFQVLQHNECSVVINEGENVMKCTCGIKGEFQMVFSYMESAQQRSECSVASNEGGNAAKCACGVKSEFQLLLSEQHNAYSVVINERMQ